MLCNLNESYTKQVIKSNQVVTKGGRINSKNEPIGWLISLLCKEHLISPLKAAVAKK